MSLLRIIREHVFPALNVSSWSIVDHVLNLPEMDIQLNIGCERDGTKNGWFAILEVNQSNKAIYYFFCDDLFAEWLESNGFTLLFLSSLKSSISAIIRDQLEKGVISPRLFRAILQDSEILIPLNKALIYFTEEGKMRLEKIEISTGGSYGNLFYSVTDDLIEALYAAVTMYLARMIDDFIMNTQAPNSVSST